MGVEPPFLYDPVKSDSARSLQEFDPKAVSRARATPKVPRQRQDGPLVSFNQHPDSYLILPHGNSDVKHMSKSVKGWIKWMRIIQLVLRCVEIIASIGLLAIMILLRGMDSGTGWIMRIPPGVAVLHTVYGVHHLANKPTGRTPASSASYMLFAAMFDVSIAGFFAFSALATKSRSDTWTTILPNQELVPLLVKLAFYAFAVGGGLYLISLTVSVYLAVTFRKISQLPPDMNPLEDNLTSRHKRNKSDMTTSTTYSHEKRNSLPLESKRSSGAVYEDLSRPPTIPFFHTRTGSTDSFSTYQSTPPPSRDSRLNLPSRQYQIGSSSPRSSIVDLKRASAYDASRPKRASYNSIPLSDSASNRHSIVDMKRATFYAGSSTSPNNGSYSEVSLSDSTSHRAPRSKRRGTAEKGSEGWYTRDSLTNTRLQASSPGKGYWPLHHNGSDDDVVFGHPNPLEANPPTPRLNYHSSRDSPLSEISNNRVSADIADSDSLRENSPVRDLMRTSKYYGDLRPGTPPIMVGANRQVSSGTDFVNKGGYKIDRREVSGKVAEEGRVGSTKGWGTRLRKISGM